MTIGPTLMLSPLNPQEFVAFCFICSAYIPILHKLTSSSPLNGVDPLPPAMEIPRPCPGCLLIWIFNSSVSTSGSSEFSPSPASF